MDSSKAKELLEKIAKAKTAANNSVTGSPLGTAASVVGGLSNIANRVGKATNLLPGLSLPTAGATRGIAKAKNLVGETPKFDMMGEAMNKFLPVKTQRAVELENNQAHRTAIRDLVVATLAMTTAGGGLAALNHFNHTPSPKKENKTKRVVEMPVPYYEKDAVNGIDDNVTSKYGLSYYIPGLVLGGVGGGGLAWKAVDGMLKAKRQKEIEENTDMARSEYDAALKNMYKRSADDSIESNLDKAFDGLEKKADENSGIPGLSTVNKVMDRLMPNTWGTAKGLMLANALVGLPVGYSLVNHQVKKNSRRKLVDDAMKERARMRAMQSPAEIYAIPTPIE